MVSLKQLKSNRDSIKSIKKITHAMKLVSASKLKRARDVVEHSRPYLCVINDLLSAISSDMTSQEIEQIQKEFPLLFGRDPSSLLRVTPRQGKHLLLVVGSTRGLCGSFNNNLVKEVKERIVRLREEEKEFVVLCVGEKVHQQLKKIQGGEVKLFEESLVKFDEIRKFADSIIEKFNDKEFDVCELFFTAFISPIVQKVSSKALIPLRQSIELETVTGAELVSYEYEPDRVSLLKDLIMQYLHDTLFEVLLEANASEHGARMTAMDNATKNAGELIDNLTGLYNKKRQAAITTELVEIISGAEALGG